MKAEHRKELQTNALADRIGRFLTGLRDRSRSNWVLIWVIALGVVLAVVFWIWKNKENKAARSEVLVTMDNLPSLADIQRSLEFHSGQRGLADKVEENLEKVIDKWRGTNAALEARFYLAGIDFSAKGLGGLTPGGSMKQALKDLKEARTKYETLAEDVQGDPFREPQALLAIAKIVETLTLEDDAHLDKARRLYEQLAEKYPNSAQGKEAAQRAKQLRDKEQFQAIKKFYTEELRKEFSADTSS
jgi:hypothetical protein